MNCKLRWLVVVILMVSSFFFTGCKEEEKIRDLEFTVVSPECLPEELLEEIETVKAEEFGFTFQDNNYLYLCVGYGQQKVGGYSICVKELYLTEKTIVLDTTLLGPNRTKDKEVKEDSYPYIVIKMEYIDAPVIFL